METERRGLDNPDLVRRPRAPPFAYYREYAPCTALRDYVYAYYSFTPTSVPERRLLVSETVFRDGDSFDAPVFADSQISLSFDFDAACDPTGKWKTRTAPTVAHILGPMTIAKPATHLDHSESVGIYFKPGQAAVFLLAPARLLTDRSVTLQDVWGIRAHYLHQELGETVPSERIDRLERALLVALARQRTSGLDITGLTRRVTAARGRVKVEQLAQEAGVSRQALSRAFVERVGVPPKLYCMLSRFHAGLTFAGRGKTVDWSRSAEELGYADQSHMIREFQRFATLTPQQVAVGEWFHPFIERARKSRAP